MEMKELEKNIKTYYLYLAFFQLLVGPILTLYFLYKGLNFTQIMTLQAIYSIGVFLLEVPTGAIGDLVGRKVSLCLAGIAMILGLLAYITGTMFFQFIIGEVLFAVGMCLKSGSDTALLYDTLKKLNRVNEFTKFQGRGQSYFLGTQIIGSVVAGFIYDINPELPMVLSIFVMSISVVIALFFKEVQVYDHKEKPNYINQIKESGKYLASHKKVRAIVIYSMFFFLFYRIGFWYYQPYLVAVHIDAKYFGILFAIYNLAATISARNSDKFVRYTKGKSMILLSVLMAVSFLMMGIITIPIGALFIILQQVARGVNNPVFMKYMNKHIPSHQRATIISFNSLLKNLAAAIAFPIIGFIMDRVNPNNINLYTGIVMSLGIIFFYYYLNEKLKKEEVEKA